MWKSNYGYIYISPRKPYSFSQTEVRHLFISVLVLTFVFFHAHMWGYEYKVPITYMAVVFLASLLAVSTAFVLHELAHKFVAIKYGGWAEYRMYTTGLIFALLLSFLGIAVAAPGAVYIAGVHSRRNNGKVALAGPMTNYLVFISCAIIVLLLISPTMFSSAYVILYYILLRVAYINLFLGFFNMLPIPPLDGSKVLAWDVKTYLVSMAVFVGSLICFWKFM